MPQEGTKEFSHKKAQKAQKGFFVLTSVLYLALF
jgi:hypothetical protein